MVNPQSLLFPQPRRVNVGADYAFPICSNWWFETGIGSIAMHNGISLVSEQMIAYELWRLIIRIHEHTAAIYPHVLGTIAGAFLVAYETMNHPFRMINYHGTIFLKFFIYLLIDCISFQNSTLFVMEDWQPPYTYQHVTVSARAIIIHTYITISTTPDSVSIRRWLPAANLRRRGCK